MMDGIKIHPNGEIERFKTEASLDDLRDEVIKAAGQITDLVINVGCNYCGFNMSITSNRGVNFVKLVPIQCPYCGKEKWH